MSSSLSTRWIATLLLTAATLTHPLSGSTHPIASDDIPPALEPWIPWVVDAIPHYGCLHLSDELVCEWPSTLHLDLTESGGTFAQEYTVERRRLVPLPGSLRQWPQSVQINNRPATVIERNGKPAVELLRGTHRLTGSFTWSNLPEGIDIPATQALVSLTLNGNRIDAVRREPPGQIWFRGDGARTQEEDQLSLEVFRNLEDGVPVRIHTTIIVRSAGKSREVELPDVQIDDTVPMEVRSELPARLDRDGVLKLQTRGGTFRVEIRSLAKGDRQVFSSKTRPAPWPQSEIWVFSPDESLRAVELSGAAGIDPARTNLPDPWKRLSAFQLTSEDRLRLTIVRRGETDPPPDRVSLSRQIWLNMNGDGLSIRDTLSGTLNRATRLNLLPEGTLGQVRVNGEGQVITRCPDTNREGVELRESHLSLTADSRLNTPVRNIPAVGWETDVHELRAQLHLPPGYRIVTARGVDALPGTWWDNWSLYSFFFVLLISIATGRLTRWYIGLLTLVTLVLLHSHADMTAVVVLSLPLLATIGLLRSLPEGRFRQWITVGFWCGVVVLAATAIPFSVNEIRNGLWPQLQVSSLDSSVATPLPLRSEKRMETIDEQELTDETLDLKESYINVEMDTAMAGSLAKPSRQRAAAASTPARTAQIQKHDPAAIVQTGSGIPSFEGNRYHLSWQGPVTADHRIQLYLTGPRTNLALAVLRVLLLTLLSALIVLQAIRYLRTPRSPDTPDTPTPAIPATTVALLLLMMPGMAFADIPSPNLLTDLQSRLSRPAPCSPDCISLQEMSLRVENGLLSMTADVHAAAYATFRVPGRAANWTPRQVTIDNRNAAMTLMQDGFLHVRLTPGIHRVVLSGPVPVDTTFTLEFGHRPKALTLNAPDYRVDGVKDGRLLDSSLDFTPLISRDLDTGLTTGAESALTPWLQVERTLELGIPWLVRTTITRVSPADAPLIVRIPLLPGESITQSEVDIQDSHLQVTLNRDQTTYSYESMLPESGDITLTAPENARWSDIWHLRCSPIWQCDTSGIAPVLNRVDEKTWRPWPGETLQIRTRRPSAADGRSSTVDQAELTFSPGLRLTEGTLEMHIRASQGTVQTVRLPQDASVQELTVNGERRPFTQLKDRLDLSIAPGTQTVQIRWQQKGGIARRFQVPVLDLGSPATNLQLSVNMPTRRWLLFLSGPAWGPAILFWGYLLTIVLVAFFILGRIRTLRVRGWQWALLLFGLTQIPIAAALVIVGWFFLMAFRERNPLERQLYVWHNLLQVGIGIYTFVTILCLFSAVYNGLAVQPDMQVLGMGSSNSVLNWYMDRIDGATPTATILSVPLLLWKLIMLGWSLWLAWRLVQWARWGFRAFTTGALWRKDPAQRSA